MTSEEKIRQALEFAKGAVENQTDEEAAMLDDALAALHSVEAEKEPVAYMDSREYRDFQKCGSGTVFRTPAHIGKSVPFYLRAACNQAQKEPVNLPPAKPDLDPVEAHKRGEFVSDVEAAYNDGWNDCRHAAMYQTEKEPE